MEEKNTKIDKVNITIVTILSIIIIILLAMMFYQHNKTQDLKIENKNLETKLNSPKTKDNKPEAYLGYTKKEVEDFIINFTNYSYEYYNDPTDTDIFESIAHGMAVKNEDNNFFFDENTISKYAKMYYNKELTHPMTIDSFKYNKNKKGYQMEGNGKICRLKSCETSSESTFKEKVLDIKEASNKIEVIHSETIQVKPYSSEYEPTETTKVYKTILIKEKNLIVESSEIIS